MMNDVLCRIANFTPHDKIEVLEYEIKAVTCEELLKQQQDAIILLLEDAQWYEREELMYQLKTLRDSTFLKQVAREYMDELNKIKEEVAI